MPDIWKGRPLPDRGPAYTDLHYRLYDERTGQVLSINSTNSLADVAADVLRTQRENPGAVVVAVEYDGPAWT
ncbi:hypothetical protein [Streptomyces sp. NPDC014623]|uniref:hypothetical protein n=1 Tax=Streptomyces sp. NPDC014623 TaxID=3364875 RepID=UPI0036FBAD83